MEMGTVGDYRLIARLGRGGMADVFLAARGGLVGFSKLAVVKCLRADVGTEEEAARYRRLLLDEARIAARLRHPNIVPVFEVGMHEDQPFLAMEYLEGQPLSRVITRAQRLGIPLPPALALRVVADTLSALDYAHRLADYDGAPLGIVHRDISPQNIFWTYGGEVKLVDFGIAKFAFGQDETETGMLKGKLGYMAPEQARCEDIDGRADLFAMGVVLWEALTGRRLLAAKTQAGQLKMLLFDLLPPLHAVKPDIDHAIASICDRALERDRANRYQSASEMRLAIERVLGETGPRHDAMAAFIQPMFAADRALIANQIRVTMSGTAPPSQLITLDRPEATPSYLEIKIVKEPTVAASPPAIEAQRRRRKRVGVGVGVLAFASSLVATLIAIASVWGNAHPSASAATAVAPAPPPPTVQPVAQPTLRLCGSNTVGAELAPVLVEAFLRSEGATSVTRSPGESGHVRITGSLDGHDLLIDITASGTATAFEGLAANSCDLGMASRAINDLESSTLQRAGMGDMRSPASEHVIALDGIAVIVHPNNPIRTLDRDTLRAIFSGTVTNWSALGGPDLPIRVLARDHHSGTFDTFKTLVLGDVALRETAQRFERSDELADAVASDPAAIGFVGLAYVRSAKAIAIGDRGAPAMLPTSFTVTTEGYLLARRLYFYTTPRLHSPLVTGLIGFAVSTQGQHAVRDAGFVDLEVVTNDTLACDARCPASYAAVVHGARRMSVDFRFRRGSDQIDSRARLDLDRVVQFLAQHPSSRVMLLGFSDSSGDATFNLRLSRQRARAISSELAIRGIHPAVIDGYGATMPIANDTTELDRERNRRVEVWLRD